MNNSMHYIKTQAVHRHHVHKPPHPSSVLMKQGAKEEDKEHGQLRSYKTPCSLWDVSGKIRLESKKFPTTIKRNFAYISLTEPPYSSTLHFLNDCLLIGKQHSLSPHPARLLNLLYPISSLSLRGWKGGDSQGQPCSGAGAAAQSPSVERAEPELRSSRLARARRLGNGK